MPEAPRIQYLFQRYIQRACTAEEMDEFLAIAADDTQQLALQNVVDVFYSQMPVINNSHTDWNRMFAIITQKEDSNHLARVHLLRSTWLRYVAAVLILFGTGAYLWMANIPGAKTTAEKAPAPPPPTDLPPGNNKALLILGDKSVLDLDSLHNGASLLQGHMQVIKSANGEVVYVPTDRQQGSDIVFINTMKTPRGGQYHLTLPDGTRVWLNAESSITFPTRFTGHQRSITMSGEVYFEVAGNPSMPFVVRTPVDSITVLGTSFNVNSYADEPAEKISLITGRVKVRQQVLKPGQAYSNGKVYQSNVNQAAAWRDGVFDLGGATVPATMRQLARWYNLEVIYENNIIPDIKLQGSMSRTLPLSSVLKGLSVVGVHCRLEHGRRLVVLSD